MSLAQDGKNKELILFLSGGVQELSFLLSFFLFLSVGLETKKINET